MKCSPALRLIALAVLGLAFTVGLIAARGRQQIPVHTPPSKLSPPYSFEPVEELSYEAVFSRLLLRNVSVAELSFKAMRAPAESKSNHAARDANANYRFTMELASKGIVPRLFGVRFHQRVESTVDPASFAMLRTTKLDEQNERRRASEAVFDRNAGKIIWTERNPNDPAQAPRVVTSETKDAMQDIVSIFYFLRTRQLAVGQSFEIPISDSGRIFSIPVKVSDEKKGFKTALGQVSTVRVDIEAFGRQRLLPGDGLLSVWLTNDARRIPVRAHVETDFGTLDIKLKRRTTGANSQSVAGD
ncbi:MAG: DUF3108 domain-containing protein [Pyrinomonadaceae bacterium]